MSLSVVSTASRSTIRKQLQLLWLSRGGITSGFPNQQIKKWLLSSAATSSSTISNVDIDPSKFISGVTKDVLEKDPTIAEFLRSNFPDTFETEEDIDNITTQAEDEQQPIKNWGEIRRSAPKPYRNIRSLISYQRCNKTEEGSRASNHLRRIGYLPGVIYGGDPYKGIDSYDRSNSNSRIYIKTPTSVMQSEWDRYRWHLESRVYDMTVYSSIEAKEHGEEGIIHRVMPRSVQRHPVNDEMMYCCNFLRYHPGRTIQLPLMLINEEESPALKRDGFLLPINRFVECIVEDGVDIPEILEVEATGLKYKEVIKLDRVLFPEGVKPSNRLLKYSKNKHEFIIGPIFGGKSQEDDETEEGAEGEGEEEEE